jgi:S-adenosylmethionine:tRNA ribosyltransferase-isomerase
MIAADQPIQRPPGARLLHVDATGDARTWPRTALPDLLAPGDLVVANDAAVLPASLFGRHEPSDGVVEVRLAGRASLDPRDLAFQAVVFGEGDYRTRTEDRAPPPNLSAGDRLILGPLSARIETLLDHPRLIVLRFEGAPGEVWAGIAHHGHPVQYAHLAAPLELWDVWAPLADRPVAFEPPSAGFALDWAMLKALRARGVGLATLTHAAGLSSTGDPALDARLPLAEAYRIPVATAEAVRRTQARGGRIVAVGTTVVRALEHAARHGSLRAGDGLADQKIGPTTRLRIVDAILSGTHETDSSHYQLLGAFTDPATLALADEVLEREAYRTHEFGESVLIERRAYAGRDRTQTAWPRLARSVSTTPLSRVSGASSGAK